MTARLLIDAGNTRVKWVVVEDKRWSIPGHAEYADLTVLSASLKPGLAVYMASVASDANIQRLENCLAAAQLTIRPLMAEAGFDGLENAYSPPEKLGVDRWMALIGARARTQSPVLVVSAGTALTIDALSASGRFLGGLIVPGSAMMRAALQTGTAHVHAASGEKRDFPNCTADAVESGIVEAMAGAIRTQRDRLARLSGGSVLCFMTGGDAQYLMPSLEWPVQHLPALVLEGMDCVTGKDQAR